MTIQTSDTDPGTSIREILSDAKNQVEQVLATCPSFRDVFPELAAAVENLLNAVTLALESETSLRDEVEKIRQAARYTLSKADELDRVIESSVPTPPPRRIR